jgi:hypothetical protein
MGHVCRNISAFLILAAFMATPGRAEAPVLQSWEQLLKSDRTWNIYLEPVVNDSKDKNVSTEKVGDIFKNIFIRRIQPDFNVVDKKDDADLIFSATITEYIWMEKAPVTDVYGPGALALDFFTKDLKEYARMILEYKLEQVSDGRLLLDNVSQITEKKWKMPEEKSYEYIYEDSPRILKIDLFKRYDRHRKGK